MNLNVQQVKDYAMQRYNKGGDTVIECWSDADIQEAIDDGDKTKKAWKSKFDTYYYNRLDVQKFIF